MKTLMVAVGLFLGENPVNQAPAPAPTVDPSKATFLIRTCDTGMWRGTVLRRVIGTVARDVDLSNEDTIGQLLQMAAEFAQSKCPSPHPFGDINVYLRPGDPTTFTDYKQGFEHVPDSNLGVVHTNPPDSVVASTSVMGREPVQTQLKWRVVRNFAKELRAAKDAEAAALRQQEAAREEQRKAAQRSEAQVVARSVAFLKANGATKGFVNAELLAANPFAYQGEVVALYGVFEQMNSATQGLFSVDSKPFVVSAIPAARFTRRGSLVILAGRVIGNLEIKLPVVGPTLVPHLRFVGSAFCQEHRCSDYSVSR
jgi:hypothetical protein